MIKRNNAIEIALDHFNLNNKTIKKIHVWEEFDTYGPTNKVYISGYQITIVSDKRYIAYVRANGNATTDDII